MNLKITHCTTPMTQSLTHSHSLSLSLSLPLSLSHQGYCSRRFSCLAACIFLKTLILIPIFIPPHHLACYMSRPKAAPSRSAWAKFNVYKYPPSLRVALYKASLRYAGSCYRYKCYNNDLTKYHFNNESVLQSPVYLTNWIYKFTFQSL